MIQRISELDLTSAVPVSRLFGDFIGSLGTGVPPFLSGIPSGASAWRDRARATVEPAHKRPGGGWNTVRDEVIGLSRRLGTAEEVLERLRDDRTLFIVTGQQPGALGGPLHTIYKAATAVALSEWLESAMELPCVALYWCGADDPDFSEIRTFHALSADLSPISGSIPGRAHRPGVPVGDIDVDQVSGLWKGIEPLLRELPGHGHVSEFVARCIELGTDHGEVSAAVVSGVLEGRLAVVDGRSPAVRRHASTILTRYLDDELEIKAQLRQQGERLVGAGYHAQLQIGDDSGVFLMEHGVRKSVTSEKVPDLLEALGRDPAVGSPGVVARNLVQDFTFQPVAVVLGPAEIAYRAQIEGLYGRLQLARPVEFPRLFGTLVPRPLLDLTTGEPDIELLVRDPAGFARHVFGRTVSPGVEGAATRLQQGVERALDEFVRSVGSTLPSKSLKKMEAKVKDVRRRLGEVVAAALDSGKREAIVRSPFLAHLDAIIRPGGRAQERSLSCLTPLLLSEEPSGTGLLDLARGHVDQVMDGHARHVVYSAGS